LRAFLHTFLTVFTTRSKGGLISESIEAEGIAELRPYTAKHVELISDIEAHWYVDAGRTGHAVPTPRTVDVRQRPIHLSNTSHDRELFVAQGAGMGLFGGP
jgi:hypothetical protein